MKDEANREAGPGQHMPAAAPKLPSCSPTSLLLGSGLNSDKPRPHFPLFTPIEYNLTVTAVILLQTRKNTE